MPPPRTAELVLVLPDGSNPTVLPPISVSTPWWHEAEPVVEAARAHFGIEVTILRMLNSELDEPHGGRVTYLAESRQPVAGKKWNGSLGVHALRRNYAEAGGPQKELDWADKKLRAAGIVSTGAPVQVRSWNLSSIWRLPTSEGTVWLKSIPPFFAHEGRILAELQGQPVPQLIAADDQRLLLRNLGGIDLHDPVLGQRLEMIALLVRIQSKHEKDVQRLLQLGLPDWRSAALSSAIEDVVDRTNPFLSPDHRTLLAKFACSLERRFLDLEGSGIGDSLVHGDFHPGNFRGARDDLWLLDWGDSGIGHPLLDQPAFLERAPASSHGHLKARWNEEIRLAWPHSDPDRAASLLEPIAAARQAVIYRKFLDNIEPSEQIYHAKDPLRWLMRTAVILERSAAQKRA